MTEIPTATGGLAAGDLGRVLMHEHVFLGDLEYELNYPSATWSLERRVAAAVETFSALRRAGIDTIVDVTVPGLGRDVSAVIEVARKAEVNIVLATGYFVEDVLPLPIRMRGPGRRLEMDCPLHEMFLSEIRDGISGTAARAGIIKISSDRKGMTPDIRRVFEAAANAQRVTGTAITTHSDAASKGGLEQQAVLKACGADLGRVVIGHSGDSTDLDYLVRMMDAGSYIGMDRFGFAQYLPNADRIDTVVALVERGYADRMVLSHDANVYSAFTPPEFRNEMRDTLGYEWDFAMIPDRILPELLARGVPQDALDQMLIHTPRRLLTPGG